MLESENMEAEEIKYVSTSRRRNSCNDCHELGTEKCYKNATSDATENIYCICKPGWTVTINHK